MDKLYERARQISISACGEEAARKRLEDLYAKIDRMPDVMVPSGVAIFSCEKDFGSPAFQMGYQFALLTMYPTDPMGETWRQLLEQIESKRVPGGTIDFAAALAKKRQQ